MAAVFYHRAYSQLQADEKAAPSAYIFYYLGLVNRFGLGTRINTQKVHNYLNKACNLDFGKDCADLSDKYVQTVLLENRWSSPQKFLWMAKEKDVVDFA